MESDRTRTRPMESAHKRTRRTRTRRISWRRMAGEMSMCMEEFQMVRVEYPEAGAFANRYGSRIGPVLQVVWWRFLRSRVVVI